MSRDRLMGTRGFVLHQFNQVKRLTLRLIKCWHNSYELQSQLAIVEMRLIEAQKKYETLVNNLDGVRATCPCIDQCPINHLEL